MTLGGWPDVLGGERRYLPWRARVRASGRIGKVPMAPDGLMLRPQNPLQAQCWVTLPEAVDWVKAGQADGVGVVVTPGWGWVALDLDDCLQPDGSVTDVAQGVLEALASGYVECSPGGTGLHVLVRGRVPSGWRRVRGVEVIDRGYVTATGRVWRAATDFGDATPALQALHARLSPRRPACVPAAVGGSADDQQVLGRAFRARNAGRFAALWRGEQLSYPSASEGDLALVLMLMHWAGRDASMEQIDRLFRRSGRFRPRWDDPPQYPYGERTLARAREIRAGGRT